MKQLLFTFLLFSCLGAFSQVVEITELRLSENWFESLDEATQNPEKVFYLDLSLQKLKTFPPEILTFTNLERLYLPYNYWRTVPNEINRLKKLEILDLSGNYYLNKLPDGLLEMSWLKELIILDNKLNAGEAERVKKALPNLKVQTSLHTGH